MVVGGDEEQIKDLFSLIFCHQVINIMPEFVNGQLFSFFCSSLVMSGSYTFVIWNYYMFWWMLWYLLFENLWKTPPNRHKLHSKSEKLWILLIFENFTRGIWGKTKKLKVKVICFPNKRQSFNSECYTSHWNFPIVLWSAFAIPPPSPPTLCRLT